MSLVVFPFLTEDPDVVAANIRVAAFHPAVDLVLCVGAEQEETFHAIRRLELPAAASPVELILQERVGTLRSGKGDGMNTALRYFVDQTSLSRIHFYDADITNFGPEWISRAEAAADQGFGVVRHYFARASTDAMITWMITRTGFALLWPETILPKIGQPLGGELLFTREVASHLLHDPRVARQGDWGIDTIYTFTTVQAGIPVYEAYVSSGKAHALYGALSDLRTMVVECFAVIQSLMSEEVGTGSRHEIEPSVPAPRAIREKVGYDLEKTLALLAVGWNDRQKALLDEFPESIRDGLLANLDGASFSFMGEEQWRDVYLTLLERFEKDDADWQELLFKLWIARVLNYTATIALRGYEFSQAYLEAMIQRYCS